jgi:uncharacterized membrane protein
MRRSRSLTEQARHLAETDGVRIAAAVALAMLVAGAGWVIERGRQRREVVKRRPDMPALAGGKGIQVERSVTILRSRDLLYGEWRDLERLPGLMSHLVSVTPTVGDRSRWVARGPGNTQLTWEAEIVADEPGHLIAWRSVGPADVENAGSVRFTPAPGDRGTEVKVILTYSPPAGRLGAVVAAMFGRSGDQEVREDLRRFKQRMEAGELATAAPRPDRDVRLVRSA